MITIEELKSKIEETGYIATEELIYETFNALCLFNDSEISPGQDIFAICLEGPPGAGKTEFAKVYTKISNKLFNGNVEMVDYQCDATTGKTELFEDINISAAIRGDADNVNIPGKLVEAIKKVNTGKKVILFIDEYDKAREETDAFMLQFLQSGKINSTQHGDMEVKEEYKGNLQVILCKNDMREELSGPLSRRIRIIRLDYMEPATFYKVANRVLVDNRIDKVNDGLLNLVSLMYQNAYGKRDLFDRLPSCSEMLIALEDADRLLKRANAPKYIIYNTIIKNMFKSPDDIKTFENGLKGSRKEDDKKLANLIGEMKKQETTSSPIDINELISQNIYSRENQKINARSTELKQLVEAYKEKFVKMEEERQATIEKELKQITLNGGKLISYNNPNNAIKNFDDSTEFVKRGDSVFEVMPTDWTNVATISVPMMNHKNFIDYLIKKANEFEITVYENGILITNNNDQMLIVYGEADVNNNMRYRIMSNTQVIPSTYLEDITVFIEMLSKIHFNELNETNNNLSETLAFIAINCLVYNDEPLGYDKVNDNVYNFTYSSKITTDIDASIEPLNEAVSTMQCSDLTNAKVASDNLTKDTKPKTK